MTSGSALAGVAGRVSEAVRVVPETADGVSFHLLGNPSVPLEGGLDGLYRRHRRLERRSIIAE
jgi:hypothetical protein